MADPTPNDAPAAKSAEAEDVGPDPVWGMGLFVLGLLIMCVAGAMTWHYTFNIGTAILLIGVVVFCVAVARTSLLQDPVDWRAKLPWADDEDDPAEDAADDAADDKRRDETGSSDGDA